MSSFWDLSDGKNAAADKTTEFERVRDIIAARAASSQHKKPEEAFS